MYLQNKSVRSTLDNIGKIVPISHLGLFFSDIKTYQIIPET